MYHHVAAAIRQQILDGQYRAGGAIPAERYLADTHEVSIATIRQALALLEGQGVIDRRAGSLARVRPVPALDLPATATLRSATNQERTDLGLLAGELIAEVGGDDQRRRFVVVLRDLHR